MSKRIALDVVVTTSDGVTPSEVENAVGAMLTDLTQAEDYYETKIDGAKHDTQLDAAIGEALDVISAVDVENASEIADEVTEDD